VIPARFPSITGIAAFWACKRRIHQRYFFEKGLFEVADQGTIFFDEIATISPETQAKLLRVIQEREFMRLGGTEQLKVDVRIRCLQHRTLTLVREGRFREDLYHRSNVIHLTLPPLRDPSRGCAHAVGAFPSALLRGKRQDHAAVYTQCVEVDDGLRLARVTCGNSRMSGASSGTFHTERVDADLLPESIRSKRSSAECGLQLSEFTPPLPGEPGARAGADQSGRRCSRSWTRSSGESSWTCSIVPAGTNEASRAISDPLSTLNQKIKRLGN